MFKVTIALKEVGEFSNFPEAFAHFYKEIEKLVESGTSLQVLETACSINWDSDLDPITGEVGKIKHYVLDFYKARDLAYHLGLLRDGKLVSVSFTP